jgi:hypothetical protein
MLMLIEKNIAILCGYPFVTHSIRYDSVSNHCMVWEVQVHAKIDDEPRSDYQNIGIGFLQPRLTRGRMSSTSASRVSKNKVLQSTVL